MIGWYSMVRTGVPWKRAPQEVSYNETIDYLFVLDWRVMATRLSAGAQERLTFLYPSPVGSWFIPVMTKEAKYFDREGLSIELVRVGGSGTIGKIDVKPERLVDFSIVDELEKSGFIDAVYKD